MQIIEIYKWIYKWIYSAHGYIVDIMIYYLHSKPWYIHAIELNFLLETPIISIHFSLWNTRRGPPQLRFGGAADVRHHPGQAWRGADGEKGDMMVEKWWENEQNSLGIKHGHYKSDKTSSAYVPLPQLIPLPGKVVNPNHKPSPKSPSMDGVNMYKPSQISNGRCIVVARYDTTWYEQTPWSHQVREDDGP